MRSTFAIAGLAAAAQAATWTVTATEEVTITSCAPDHTSCAAYKSQYNEWESWTTTTSADPSWSDWDPSKPSTKTPVATSSTTWADWDPSKPKTPVATSSTTWADWDPSKPSSKTPVATSTVTWADWDPSKPSSKTPVATSTVTWADWDPSKPSSKTPVATSSTTWANWESSKPSTTTPSCPKYSATAPPAWFSQLPTAVLSSLAAQWTGAPPSDWCYYSYSVPSVVTQTKTPVAATDSATWSAWTGTATSVKGVDATSAAPVAKWTGAANANAASFVLGGAAAIAAVILA